MWILGKVESFLIVIDADLVGGLKFNLSDFYAFLLEL